ncbi:hypothetical protein IXO884_04140, partial [Xanthomonas oryzae pv. oryzae]
VHCGCERTVRAHLTAARDVLSAVLGSHSRQQMVVNTVVPAAAPPRLVNKFIHPPLPTWFKMLQRDVIGQDL